MGRTTPEASLAVMNGHVQELEAFCELTLDCLLPHVEAILSELERRLPPEAVVFSSPAETTTPSSQSTPQRALHVKREKSKTRPSRSPSASHPTSHLPKQAEVNPAHAMLPERSCTPSTQSYVESYAGYPLPAGSSIPHISSATKSTYTSSCVRPENSRAGSRRLKLTQDTVPSTSHFSSASISESNKCVSPDQILCISNSSSSFDRLSASVNSTSSISSPNEFLAVSQNTSPFPTSRSIPEYSTSTRGTSENTSVNSSVSFRVSTRTSTRSVSTGAPGSNSDGSFVSPRTLPSNLPTTPARVTTPSSITDASPEEDSATEQLLSSAKRGNVEGVLAALEAGTDINGRDKSGKTALHLASWSGHADVVALLLTSGADASNRGNPRAYTPLHVASFAGHAQCVAFLLDAGVHVDCRSKNGSTPLHMAALNGHETIVQLLVAAGASREIKDESGKTAYDMAETVAIREVLLL